VPLTKSKDLFAPFEDGPDLREPDAHLRFEQLLVRAAN
jgi:hypothetical protein